MSTGIKKTRQIIKYLSEKRISVDLVISSPAIRALETAKLVAAGLDYPIENIKQEPALYDARLDDYLNLIHETPDEINSLMIFGHNPTITRVANIFLDQGIDILPTSGVVAISFETEHWIEISKIQPVQKFLVFPKMLKS